MYKPAVICDIDGTLADCSHRLHYISGGKKDWEGFFSEMGKDSQITPVCQLLSCLSDRNWEAFPDLKIQILFVSGRPEEYREKTIFWIENQGLSAEKLYMRPTGDHRSDTVVKEEILDKLLLEDYTILFAIDDRPSILAMWQRRGIFTFQVKSHWDSEEPNVGPGLLTLMIGPSGAGKSSWLAGKMEVCNRIPADFGILPSQVISTDSLRAEICGDFMDQSQNDRVFKTLHALVKSRISLGLNTVVDATNLRRRDRLAIIESSDAKRVRYIVMNRLMEEKIKTAGWRLRVPGLLERHEKSFRSGLNDILSGDGIEAEVISLLENKRD